MPSNLTLTTRQAFHDVKRNWLAFGGGLLVLGVFVIAILAPWIAPHDPSKINIKDILTAPSMEHPFGTDELGRDVLSRMIWGARVSLEVGFVAIGIPTRRVESQ